MSIPLKIDDKRIIAHDELTKKLGERLRGRLIDRISLQEAEKAELKNIVAGRGAAFIPMRVGVVYWLESLKLSDDPSSKAVINGLIEHELDHLKMAKEKVHYRISNFLIDCVLIAWIYGLDSRIVSDYIKLLLRHMSIHSLFAYEGSAFIMEKDSLQSLPIGGKLIEDRLTQLKSLEIDPLKELTANNLKDKCYAIGVRLYNLARKNLGMSIPKIIDVIHSFYAQFVMKKIGAKFNYTCNADYILLTAARLEEYAKDEEEGLKILIEKLKRSPAEDLAGARIEMISGFYYKPHERLMVELKPPFNLLGDYQPLCEALWKRPLREVIMGRYVVWDLDSGEKMLFTNRAAYDSLSLEEQRFSKKLLLTLQELRGEILPIFIKAEPIWEKTSFYKFVKGGKLPGVKFGEEPTKQLEEKQSYLQKKYTNFIKEIKALIEKDMPC
jgi:hypothetical protein